MPPRIRLILAGLYLVICLLVGAVGIFGMKEKAEAWQERTDAYYQCGNTAIDSWKAGELYTADRDAEVHGLLQQGNDLPVEMNLHMQELAMKMLILEGSAALLTLLCLFLVFRSWQVRPRARRFALFATHGLTFLALMMTTAAGIYTHTGPASHITATMPPSEARFLSNVSARIGQEYTQKQHEILIQFVESEQRVANGVMQMFGALSHLASASAIGFLGLTVASAALALWPAKKQPEEQEPALLP